MREYIPRHHVAWVHDRARASPRRAVRGASQAGSRLRSVGRSTCKRGPLHTLLRAHDLSVAELKRRIEQRFGLRVDPKTLYRLASAEPVQRADLEIAGAAAAVLGVELGELFDVRAVPVDDQETIELDPAQSRRLADLFDRQAAGALSAQEQAQLEALVGEYGRRLHERRIRELARQHGISVEQARHEAAVQFDQALDWWRTFEAHPVRRTSITTRARGRRPRAMG